MKHQNVVSKIQELLNKIPNDTGLTTEEVMLEVAAKIIEEFPKNVQPDVDVNLQRAFDAVCEAGVYYGATIRSEIK